MIESLEMTIGCVAGGCAAGFGICKKFFNGRRERQFSQKDIEQAEQLVRVEEGLKSLGSVVEVGFTHVNRKMDQLTEMVNKWHDGK